MRRSANHIVIILLLIILISLPQVAIANDSNAAEPTIKQKFPWSDLTFTGTKFFSSINVKIHLGPGNQVSDAPAKKTAVDPIDCSKTDNESKLLTLKWSLKGIIAQGKYEVKTWFKTADGLPYKRTRFRNDDDPWVKSYFWEDGGMRRLRIKPLSPAEEKQPPSSWTKRTESFYEYPKERSDCSSVMDAPLVFYLLSTLDLTSKKGPYEICVFGKKQLHRLTIRQEESPPMEVSFITRTPSQKEETIKGQITPLVYSIKTESLAPEKEEAENFSLLGLHKNIRIYMDPEKLLPVRISGTNNIIGKLELELRTAGLN